MCTYNTISSHADNFEIQKRDSEESLLTLVNLFPRLRQTVQTYFDHGLHCLPLRKHLKI